MIWVHLFLTVFYRRYYYVDNDKFLELLLQYPQKIFSKQNLYESIWNEPYAYDDDTINTHISHIRKKIKSITNEDYIQTIWGIGYKMK